MADVWLKGKYNLLFENLRMEQEMRENISDKVIEKAVELWARKLYNPSFDNGDNSESGGMTFLLATMNILTDKAEIKDMESRVKVFCDTLTKTLKDKRDRREYLPYLSVDYGPCRELAEAADVAGIPHSQFSCKSSVYMHDGYVGMSFGYGARTSYYYPLPDGRWLVTDILGTERGDIEKIISHVAKGNEMGFVVEK